MKTDNAWQDAYRAAILETDDKIMPGRLRAAKTAIEARAHELYSERGGAAAERSALSDALAGLTVLREELEARSQNDPICRICGKPVPLVDCTRDENGKAVHKSCCARELLANAAGVPAEPNSKRD